jgi:SAM-dependent methyltransferase
MATVDENLQHWSHYDWGQSGDEWSVVWGGTGNLWWGTLYPRIRTLLPTGTALELGPGYGRFSQYLKEYCRRLYLVDLTERCIDACRERFAGVPHLSFHVNDGRTLPMVPAGSLDLVFSFDSLVHAEGDVMRAYLKELARAMAPDAVGVIHHSNLAHFLHPESGALPFENRHWRASTVSAARVARWCDELSLACVAQEIVNWGGEHLTDCISVFTPKGSRHERPLLVRENPHFMAEARRLAAIGQLYHPPPVAGREPVAGAVVTSHSRVP